MDEKPKQWCPYLWGPALCVHMCEREPGHEGAHECPCGASVMPR